MHFGPLKKTSFIALLMIGIISCRDKETPIAITFAVPNTGDNLNLGQGIKVKLNIPAGEKITAVNYLIDGKLVSTKPNGDSTTLSTQNLPLGYRMITAIVKHNSKLDTITTNIVLKTNRAPLKLKYTVVKTFPHNTTAYTEGLSFVDGKLLESTGEKGASMLKYVELKSGKDLKSVKLDPQYFGEGSLKLGDRIIMLTWRENIGFIFDAKTFKQLGTFLYQNSREGWGLTFDGKAILRTDGTNRIWRMDPETFKEESYLEVYDNKGPIDSLNELEYIDGKIYANVYLTSKILRIDPITGIVEAEIDLSALVPKNYYKTSEEEQNNVLNGIAWDASAKRLFVTGKKWPKLYEIKLIP